MLDDCIVNVTKILLSDEILFYNSIPKVVRIYGSKTGENIEKFLEICEDACHETEDFIKDSLRDYLFSNYLMDYDTIQSDILAFMVGKSVEDMIARFNDLIMKYLDTYLSLLKIKADVVFMDEWGVLPEEIFKELELYVNNLK